MFACSLHPWARVAGGLVVDHFRSEALPMASFGYTRSSSLLVTLPVRLDPATGSHWVAGETYSEHGARRQCLSAISTLFSDVKYPHRMLCGYGMLREDMVKAAQT